VLEKIAGTWRLCCASGGCNGSIDLDLPCLNSNPSVNLPHARSRAKAAGLAVAFPPQLLAC